MKLADTPGAEGEQGKKRGESFGTGLRFDV